MDTIDVKTNWNQVYILTKHWKSDLEFYKMDLDFLKGLIGKYFIWLNKDQNIKNLLRLKMRIQLQLTELDHTNTLIDEHLKHLQERMHLTAEQEGLRIENDVLEMRIANLLMAFKALKAEVLQTTELVIEEEKLERFVNPQTN